MGAQNIDTGLTGPLRGDPFLHVGLSLKNPKNGQDYALIGFGHRKSKTRANAHGYV